LMARERVRATEWLEEGYHHHDLVVAPSDRGRDSGRGGRTADALRTLVEAMGRRRGTPCDLEIVD
jgi:predicted RNA-binding protein YlqC (UPF0109 family)